MSKKKTTKKKAARKAGPRSALLVDRSLDRGLVLTKRKDDLQQDIAKERERREAEFRAHHRAESRKRARGASAGLLEEPRQIRIAAEGDSWFDYPPQTTPDFRTGGVISHLEDILGVPVLNYAHAGDEAREMMGLRQRQRLVKLLSDPEISPDVLLFSGGGNDIVGDPMVLWLRDKSKCDSWREAVDTERFNSALGVVLSAYSELVALLQTHGERCVLFLHAYAVPFPDGRKACGLFGPWLKPALDARGWSNFEEARSIVGLLLRGFRESLERFSAANAPRVHLIDSQSLLPEQSMWANELHPKSPGFRSVAKLFAEAIRLRF